MTALKGSDPLAAEGDPSGDATAKAKKTTKTTRSASAVSGVSRQRRPKKSGGPATGEGAPPSAAPEEAPEVSLSPSAQEAPPAAAPAVRRSRRAAAAGSDASTRSPGRRRSSTANTSIPLPLPAEPQAGPVPPEPQAGDVLSEAEAIVSTLPPFYAPHKIPAAVPGESAAPEGNPPPSVAAPEEDPLPDVPDVASPAEDSAEVAVPAEDGAEVAVSALEAGKGEKKRRSRGRRGRSRKKTEGQLGESRGLPEEEGSLSPDAGFQAREALVGEGPLAGEEALVQALDLGGKPRRNRKAGESGGAEAGEEVSASGKKDKRKMFVSVLPGEQVEVVVAEEGLVCEYYVEMLHQAKTKGNVYKAVIHNVDPNLQAVFVNYGAAKNGFLQIDEVHPEYFNVSHDPAKGHKYPPIQKVLKAGQEILVQVVKEPAGTKGAFLTTYLSLPGRFLVLTPGREQIGVSRKVEQEEERSRLRDLLEGLSPGPGLGVIVRTVSVGASKTNLQRDLQYLKRLWKDVRKRGTEEKPPCLIYQEMDLTTRAARDYLTDDIAEVWVDDEATFASLTELAEILFPRKQNLVCLHKNDGRGLLERFNLQRQLDQIHAREVNLPSGGQLVFDPTEALTAIDINSGRSGGKSNFEDMAFRTNLEAARMIPLQLRLRDIGGQVVADFIEMRDKSHWREVEKALRAGMKEDRARYDVGKIGPFGMLEIVRQRLGSSAISTSTEICPHCRGTGVRRNIEWRCQQALRDIARELRAAAAESRPEFVYAADPDLALHLLNHKRERLLEMEKDCGLRLEIAPKHLDG